MRARRVGTVRGIVQGVGFRPFVARLAREEAIGGRVENAGGAVHLDVEGEPAAVARFLARLEAEAPPAARIDAVALETAPPTGAAALVIEASAEAAAGALPLPPDLATCADCLAEVDDPAARRAGYPFTNCTQCGPRFTIATALPYDRERTTVARFAMCEDCAAEYGDVADRRHHAQPIACPACGPSLVGTDSDGAVLARRADALAAAIAELRRGGIVALKGLGGYQLLCDATDDAAVARLRARKRREAKPLAVLVADLAAARRIARVSDVEARALGSAAGPIVLLARRGGALADGVAPGLGRIGVLLPTTPLHHLVARALGPLVCTSGNLHDEPIAIDDADARARLAGIADLFLAHDRPIARRADDGVVHVVRGEGRVLRLGRGLGPASFDVGGDGVARLCVGAHLKNAPAAALGARVVLWPHVGDLDGPRARAAFEEAVADLSRFLALEPREVVCDRHPDYATTIWAERAGLPVRRLPHHAAHVAACLAEHGVERALGVAWDGFGLGDDGGLWGGEALEVDGGRARRVASLRPFPLPGGDAAARDGRRALAGLLVAAGRDPEDPEVRGFLPLASAPATRVTSSVGRLFDAVAALVGVCASSRYEGEAAMRLEALAEPGAAPYPMPVVDRRLDWAPMLDAILADPDPVRVASRFHATLAAAIRDLSVHEGASRVALAGGCFANARLAEDASARLEDAGIEVLLPSRAPVNDGGLALGQAWLAARGGG